MTWITYIIPLIFAFLTGHKREIVRAGNNFKWSGSSWTYNAFRVYEIICGRRWGIRAEMTTFERSGKAYRYAHSGEAACVLAERYVRESVKGLLNWRPKPIQIYIPQLQTSHGFPPVRSPFLFAIAFDVMSFDNTSASSPVTSSSTHDVTGSDTLLVVGIVTNGTTSGLTFGGAALTQSGTGTTNVNSQKESMWYLLAPTTTASAVITTAAGCTYVRSYRVSYSGVLQSDADLDSHAQATTSSVTVITPTTTVVASGCWLVAFCDNDANNLSAGANTTERCSDGATDFYDSNATVGTGSQSLNVDIASSAANAVYHVLSMAPVADAAAPPISIISDFIIFN